jgi:hypothetical protein
MMNETRLRNLRRPSPSMVVALIAVLAALVGTAVGAKLWGYSRAGSPNLILDPGFERKTQKDWRIGERGEQFAPLRDAPGHEVARITTDASRGKACVQISGTGGNYLYQRVYLPLGDYRITYWRKTIEHVGNTGAGLTIADETGVHTGDATRLYPNLGTTPWMQVPAITITVTEAGAFGFFFVSNGLRAGGMGSGTVRLDRIEVEAL